MHKDYKALLENRTTKERKIYYCMAPTLAVFKGILKGSFPEYKIVEAKVNRESAIMYYCNTCQTEIRNTDRETHSCVPVAK